MGMRARKKIAIFAGTGLASRLAGFLERSEVATDIPVEFGDRQGKVLFRYSASLGPLEVIVIPRHGPTLEIPDRSPAELVRQYGHEAHIWYLHQQGVSAIYTFNSVGAIDRSVPLAADNGFLIPNEMIRGIGMGAHSFGKLALTVHPSMRDPFDAKMRAKLKRAVDAAGAHALTEGTYINSLGDVFESAAEVQAYRNMYASAKNRVLGMTCGPEIQLARQMNIPYAAICGNCNWAEGLDDQPVTHEHVLSGMEPAAATLREIARHLVMIEAAETESRLSAT